MKKCKNCNERFETRFSTLEKYCWNPDCKTIEAMYKLEKLKKRDLAKNKQKIKAIEKELETIQQKVLRVQAVFNKFIRLRDNGKECISCDTILNFEKKKFDAGHLFNANNHWNIRFDEQNVNGQCVKCNKHLHGNLLSYREKMIQRWGEDTLNRLQLVSKKIRHFTKFELEEILDEYKYLNKNYNKLN